MADFDPDAFLGKKPAAASFDPDAFLKDQATARGEVGFADPSQVQPSAEERLRQKEAVGVRNAVRKEREQIVRDNAEAGVPLNPTEELPASLRARLSFEGNIDKQVEQLAKRDDVLGARKSKDGRNVIVRISGDTGPRDVLLHPKGAFSAGDVAGATAPLIKAGVAAGVGMAAAPLSLPLAAAAMGGNAALNEVVSSGGSRLLAGQSLDPKELGGEALREGTINAALPMAMGTGVAAARGARNLLTGGAGELERKLPAAAERLGVGTSLAETSGSPTLAKLGKLKPDEEDARQMALRIAKDRGVAGSKPMPLASEADIAANVQPIFAQAERTADRGVRSAMTDAERAAQQQIQTELDSGIVPTTRSTSEVGDFIRNKIAGKAADSKTTELRAGAEKLYGAANQLAEQEGVTVAPTHVSALRADLDADTHRALIDFAPGIKKIPALERLLTEPVAVDTGVLDAAGKKVIELTPPPPLTVPQARELRSVVYEMAHTPGPPGEGGVPRRYLTRLYKAIDDDLGAAIKSGTPELQQAHAAADEFYKTKLQPLQQSDVAKLFLETDAAGRMGGDEVVRRLFRGDGNLDALRAYRNVLGKDSPEWKLLVRQGVQTVMDDAGARTGMIDAGKFLTRLEQLGKTEVADEIIGPVAKTLRSDATLMARAQGKKISEDELTDALLASPTKAGKLLQEAIAREDAYNRTYQSAVQKQLRDGVLGPRTMGSADDFVTRFIEGKETSVEDVRQALTQIGAKAPEQVEAIRQRVLQNVLNRATKPDLGQMTTRASEDLDTRVLADALKGTSREKLRVAVGEKGIQFLDDLATYSEATAMRQAREEAGRKAAPETIAKEVGSAAIGFKRNAIGALVDTLPTIAGRPLGAVVRNPAVRRFIETGQLPSFSAATKGALFAAPRAVEARNDLLAEKQP